MSESRPGLRRKFVGISETHPTRRDFVRIKGQEHNTCLTTKLLLFVTLSGFAENATDGFVLPPSIRNHYNTCSVDFALVRWLSPHPDSMIRDSKLRPICKPPLDINHALWTYSRRPSPRNLNVTHHTKFYSGDNAEERLLSLENERHAFFDMIQPDSFLEFVNCTSINTSAEIDTILETITLPFDEVTDYS